MPRLISREFDAARPTYARRAFLANGHRYAGGELFDWRKLAVDQRKAKQLFDSGHITHKDEEPVLVESKPDPVAEKALAEQYGDDLDAIDDMKELRAIADAEGAPYKVSKADQRQAIRDNRTGDDA